MSTGDKVVVAMSGGVDSSVAAGMLQEQGYDCTGLFMRLGLAEQRADGCDPGRHRGCCSALDAADARAVAGRLGIPFYALNFSDEFDRVIDYFAAEYGRGRTPNPCVVCNRDLKFGRLLAYADAIGARYIATGHYARIGNRGGRPVLRRGADLHKDQSYVLFPILRKTWSRVLLPLGELTKDEVRARAERSGLGVHDKPDSSDICFAPDRDYARVVRERLPEAFGEGEVRDQSGREIGRHEGTPNFTIGQRRGLGIATGAPVYVTEIDSAANAITIGPKEGLLAGALVASDMNWLGSPPPANQRVRAQIRYSHRAAPARVAHIESARCLVRFEEPQPAVTPGQAVVLYDGNVVLGGGWIDRAVKS